MVAPSWFPGPKPNHVISLCLKKLFVWKYVLLVHVQLSPGNPAIFFPSPRSFGSTHLHEASFLPSFLPKSFREETLVPGHGQDFNTLLCTAWNEPKIALWNDWSRRHFVKNVGSYKMIRPTKNTLFTKWHGWPEKCPYKMPPFVRKMPLEWNMGQAIS